MYPGQMAMSAATTSPPRSPRSHGRRRRHIQRDISQIWGEKLGSRGRRDTVHSVLEALDAEGKRNGIDLEVLRWY
jgi:hypothetical protein